MVSQKNSGHHKIQLAFKSVSEKLNKRWNQQQFPPMLFPVSLSFRLWQQYNRILLSSGLSCCITGWLVCDIVRQHGGLIFKGWSVQWRILDQSSSNAVPHRREIWTSFQFNVHNFHHVTYITLHLSFCMVYLNNQPRVTWSLYTVSNADLQTACDSEMIMLWEVEVLYEN
jgi:hypothetical protein